MEAPSVRAGTEQSISRLGAQLIERSDLTAHASSSRPTTNVDTVNRISSPGGRRTLS